MIKRIYSIDFMRGFVMIIMALDHVRDMIHITSITQSPTNLETTTPALFFTRWITYLCAPIFVFLAGASAYISVLKHNNISGSRNALISRGIYLILLELVVVNFALFFDFRYHTLLFEVIASTGFGFIALGLMLKLPVKLLGAIGIAIIFCHNLAPLIPLPETSVFKKIMMPFFAPGAFPFSNKVFIMGYPPIPWLGIMLVGFACGKLFELQYQQQNRICIGIGASALLLFIAIRFINIYGDPAQWAAQKNAVFTFLSFMNVTKYPPSLLFCLVTLGTMFLFLAFAGGEKNKLAAIVSVYGKVPLFYFLVHFFLIHFVLIVVMFLQGFQLAQMDFTSGTFGRPRGVESGLSLATVYMIWVGVVTILYWPCQWFGKYKAEHKKWWLKYI